MWKKRTETIFSKIVAEKFPDDVDNTNQQSQEKNTNKNNKKKF